MDGRALLRLLYMRLIISNCNDILVGRVGGRRALKTVRKTLFRSSLAYISTVYRKSIYAKWGTFFTNVSYILRFWMRFSSTPRKFKPHIRDPTLQTKVIRVRVYTFGFYFCLKIMDNVSLTRFKRHNFT